MSGADATASPDPESTAAVPADAGDETSPGGAKVRAGKKKAGPWARLRLFVRQVVSEMRKVIWPTRPQLFGYTMVVLVFVVAVGLAVAALDLVFTRGVLWVFG